MPKNRIPKMEPPHNVEFDPAAMSRGAKDRVSVHIDEQAEATMNAIMDIKKQVVVARRENVRIFLDGIKSLNSIVEQFYIPTWHALVDYIKIMPDKNIVFHLRNGCEEIVPLAEVQ